MGSKGCKPCARGSFSDKNETAKWYVFCQTACPFAIALSAFRDWALSVGDWHAMSSVFANLVFSIAAPFRVLLVRPLFDDVVSHELSCSFYSQLCPPGYSSNTTGASACTG